MHIKVLIRTLNYAPVINENTALKTLGVWGKREKTGNKMTSPRSFSKLVAELQRDPSRVRPSSWSSRLKYGHLSSGELSQLRVK